MLNFTRETRAVVEGLHNITLEIPEKTYRTFYKELNEECARDILIQYLKHHQDDGRASDIKIEHNEDLHTVNINANLHYIGNEKTNQEVFTDNYIRS